MIRERQREADKLQRELSRKIQGLQESVYLDLRNHINKLSTDEKDQFKLSVSNMAKAAAAAAIFEKIIRKKTPSVSRFISSKIRRAFNFGVKGFEQAKNVNQAIRQRARNRVMIRLGFDLKKNKSIPGGWLDNITSSKTAQVKAVAFIIQGIGGNMTKKQFQRAFKERFIRPGGLGMIQKHFFTTSNDIFHRYDRVIQDEIATELGLEFALYSGPEDSKNRPFCAKRVGQVFHKSEIEKFNPPSKIGIYNPFEDLGGPGCRHSLTYLTNDQARKRGKDVDKFV